MLQSNKIEIRQWMHVFGHFTLCMNSFIFIVADACSGCIFIEFYRLGNELRKFDWERERELSERKRRMGWERASVVNEHLKKVWRLFVCRMGKPIHTHTHAHSICLYIVHQQEVYLFWYLVVVFLPPIVRQAFFLNTSPVGTSRFQPLLLDSHRFHSNPPLSILHYMCMFHSQPTDFKLSNILTANERGVCSLPFVYLVGKWQYLIFVFDVPVDTIKSIGMFWVLEKVC